MEIGMHVKNQLCVYICVCVYIYIYILQLKCKFRIITYQPKKLFQTYPKFRTECSLVRALVVGVLVKFYFDTSKSYFNYFNIPFYNTFYIIYSILLLLYLNIFLFLLIMKNILYERERVWIKYTKNKGRICWYSSIIRSSL